MEYPTTPIQGYHMFFRGADYFFVSTQKRLTDRLIAAMLRWLFPDATEDYIRLRIKTFRFKIDHAEFFKTDEQHATISNETMQVSYCTLGEDCFLVYL